MKTSTALKKAIKITGLSPLARGLSVHYQAITGWCDRERMPDTEYSGRSHHAVKIQQMTEGKVTVSMLLNHVPVAAQQYADKHKIDIS